MVVTVDTVYMYHRENAKKHNTEQFEVVDNSETAVLRRGQPFFLSLTLSRLPKPHDDVRIIFRFGQSPNPLKDTAGIIRIPAVEDRERSMSKPADRWECRLDTRHKDGTLILLVQSPCDAPVGLWRLSVETRDTHGSSISTYDHPEQIYFLFNPWLPDDAVYQPNEPLLDEFVLNDIGKLWLGKGKGREWVFGQFDACVLPATMLILDRSGLRDYQRGDPVSVSRALTKLVNSNDDDGVLVGRWDGQYVDGTPPSAWTGSVPILERYLDTQVPVQYGQCWVFAGVLTTLFRALGLPSRVVTNLVSAHDGDATLSVDFYVAADMNELPVGGDSIWNYHVWTEVWMTRSDLPSGYGGWQAVDATPQETSDGFFQCGPAPVEAIKRGAAGLRYDVGFMVASVNADILRWKQEPTAELGFVRVDTNQYTIGQTIMTKKPWIYDPIGNEDLEDITETYKGKEGTAEERLALRAAVLGSARAKRFYDVVDSDYGNGGTSEVTFEFSELDVVPIGDPFYVALNVTNNSSEVRRIQTALSASSVYYTGIRAHIVKRASGTFKVQPQKTETLKLTVYPNDYVNKLVEYCNMKIFAIATVCETNQTWAAEDDFRFDLPSLRMTVKGEAHVGYPCTVQIDFSNPLPVPLTDCRIDYEGPGFAKTAPLTYRDIGPKETVHIEVRVVPQRLGAERRFIAVFSSTELKSVTGSVSVDVV